MNAESPEKNAQVPHRLRLAVLLDHLNAFSGGYEAQLRDALHAKCREAGHHLLLVYGGPVEAPQPLDAADNAIYDLLRTDSVDGLIVVSSLLSTYCGPSGVARLVERFAGATMCSVGIDLPGVPSLVLDNRPGMEAVVEHLVRDHGCRRIAFLAGTPENPEAKIRFDAYQAVLARHGIASDPALTAPGYFRTNSAKVAMEEILARGVEIDGVVAANDEMATGAVDVLRKHGRRVPQDIPVTGFDDLLLARLGNPPLTTVAQPFEEVADWAVRAIEAQKAGRAVPACTQVAARFVRRQSCGCGYEAYRRDSQTMPAFQFTDTGSVAADLGSIVDRLQRLRPVLAGLLGTPTAATRLIDGLRAEIGGQSEAFHGAIVGLLDTAGTDNERQRMIHSAICYLREELRDASNLQIERILFDGLNLVALSNTTSQMQHRLLLDENYLRLLGVGEQASIAFDLASLRDALVKGLPNAGVHTVYLACVPGGTRDVLRSAMCLRDGKLVENENVEYPASQLLPPGALTDDARESFLVLPLAFENQLLGVIAFNYSDGINAYAAFRNEIAAALKSIRLREELVQTSLLHERSVQERLAATKRMEALSVLAGGVAHDLNNALGPLVALPDVILSQLAEIPGGESARDLRADVEVIKVASLRAAQTIKDLLALGRQGRMAKETLNLNRVIKSAWANSSLRFVEEGKSRINLMTDLCATPLMVRGAETQLARAVDNLLRNAVEAIGGNGEVVVKSGQIDVLEPRAGYEIVPVGRYATLSVSDDGCGIESHDLSQVFEPFFTKKRAMETSGSGLGLAIVHGVVKEHDGFIDVVSTREVGTTITLFLPLVDDLERKERPPAAPHGSARILIVDDEPIQLRTGRRVLVRLGYEVEVMDSGLRAYELFSRALADGQSPFDLIIMDMLLGEVHDGLEIIEQIQRLFPALKAIVASGHAPTERAELAVRKGLAWLGKPYGMDTLAETVQRVLRDDADLR